MVLACGCEGECCGICSLAAAAGRPRLLNREDAAAWKYPSLNAFRGKAKATDRNSDHGEPTLWFWQMEGTRCASQAMLLRSSACSVCPHFNRRWPRDEQGRGRSRAFDTACKAWDRLAATDAERADETSARYARADEQHERISEQERAEAEQQWAEKAAAAEQAKRSRMEQRRVADEQLCSRQSRVSAPRAAREDVRSRRQRQSLTKRFPLYPCRAFIFVTLM